MSKITGSCYATGSLQFLLIYEKNHLVDCRTTIPEFDGHLKLTKKTMITHLGFYPCLLSPTPTLSSHIYSTYIIGEQVPQPLEFIWHKLFNRPSTPKWHIAHCRAGCLQELHWGPRISCWHLWQCTANSTNKKNLMLQHNQVVRQPSVATVSEFVFHIVFPQIFSLPISK